MIYLLIVWFGSVSAEEKKITISTGEYAPWASESIHQGGFVTHVVTEAFKNEGYTVQFDYLPWKRAYEMAKNGSYDATSFWADTETEYNHYFYRSGPVMHARVVFFHLKEKPMGQWNTMTDLKRYHIGTLLGETSTKMLSKSGLDIDSAATALQCFQKLLAERIDIFPLEIMTGLELLKKEFPPETTARITYHAKPFFEPSASVMFSKSLKKSQELVTIFDRGLSRLKEEGHYEAFYEDLLAGKYE